MLSVLLYVNHEAGEFVKKQSYLIDIDMWSCLQRYTYASSE